MLLEMRQTLSLDQSRPPRYEQLAALHPLILALCLITRSFPRREPLELGSGLRAAAIAAAEAVLQGCRCRDAERATALASAAARLREIGCCLDFASQLGYLPAAQRAEIAALLATAHESVSRQADSTTLTAAPPQRQAWAASTRRAGSLSQ